VVKKSASQEPGSPSELIGREDQGARRLAG
jgi:hypothetical protein